MKGARALASAALLLAAICLVPAVSAAQDAGAPSDTTTTAPSEPAPPPSSEPAPQESTTPEDPTPAKEEGGTEKQAASGQGDASAAASAAPEPTGSEGTGGKARKSATVTVTMGDNFFEPETVTISVGDLVTWRNSGDGPHTATADDGSFDTGTVASGQRASRMFTRAGTFSYICTIHPEMKGTVRVTGNGGGTAGSSSTAGPSEAEAVASPDAAGDKNTLPASGMAAGVVALVGAALLASGLLVRHRGLKAARAAIGRQLTLF